MRARHDPVDNALTASFTRQAAVVPPPLVPPALGGQVFTVATARAAGITRDHLRSAAWRHVLRDVWCDAALPDGLELRVRAAALILPRGGALAGTTAAWLHGADIRRPEDPVEVLCPAGRTVRQRKGLAVRTSAVPDADVTEVHGVCVTTPLRTATDLARRDSLVEAVVALDALAHERLVTLEAVQEALGRLRGRRGVRRAQAALQLASPATESPMETRLRLVLVLGGLPAPTVQLRVFDPTGREVARLDLAYEEEQVGVEYDGRTHEGRVVEDATRDNALADLDWRLKRYGAVHVYRKSALVVAQVRGELERRRRWFVAS